MKDKFVVTITDVDGSRHFLLHQIVKKFVVYITLFIFVVIIGGAWLLQSLTSEIDRLQEKKDLLSQNEYELSIKSDKLQAMINEKTEQFDMLNEKVASIEELIGITPNENLNLDKRLDKITLSAEEQKEVFSVIPNGQVVTHNGVSSPFGWRVNPIKKKKEFHPGIDLRCKTGTAVRAPSNGVVEFASYHRYGYGNLVILDHSYGFQTRYAHLSKFNVKAGQFVKKGDIIAYTGNTGLSTGPHLHYEVRFIGRLLNPKYFLNWTRKNFSQIFQKEKNISWQSLVKMITHKTTMANTTTTKPHQKQQ